MGAPPDFHTTAAFDAPQTTTLPERITTRPGRDQAVEEADMDSKYDIFRILPNGQRLWAGTVTGTEAAKQRVAQLESLAQGEYQVYDVRDGIMVDLSDATWGGSHARPFAWLHVICADRIRRMKITSVIRTLEKKQEELTKELRNVGAAIAALSGNTVRSLDSRARRKISRALKRAWRKRKKLRAWHRLFGHLPGFRRNLLCMPAERFKPSSSRM
jgi:hypothetical protein